MGVRVNMTIINQRGSILMNGGTNELNKYFKHQVGILLLAVGVVLLGVGALFILSGGWVLQGGIFLVPGGVCCVLGVLLRIKGEHLDNYIAKAADAVGNGFYDVVKYQTKKVVLDKPHVNSGYVEKNGQTRSRRGSDGKIRTDRFYVTALVNEHDRLMIRSLERSVVNDSDVSEQVFDYAYKGLSPIKVEPADTSSRVNKNFVRCTIVAPDGSEFVFLLNDNAENDKLIEQINQKINDMNSKSA